MEPISVSSIHSDKNLPHTQEIFHVSFTQAALLIAVRLYNLRSSCVHVLVLCYSTFLTTIIIIIIILQRTNENHSNERQTIFECFARYSDDGRVNARIGYRFGKWIKETQNSPKKKKIYFYLHLIIIIIILLSTMMSKTRDSNEWWFLCCRHLNGFRIKIVWHLAHSFSPAMQLNQTSNFLASSKLRPPL